MHIETRTHELTIKSETEKNMKIKKKRERERGLNCARRWRDVGASEYQ